MALRDKLRERSQPLLEPGEPIEQIFMAQTGPTPYLQAVLSPLILLSIIKRRIVVVTDRAVVVLAAGRLAGTTPKDVAVRLPRQTPIGPVSGLWAKIVLNDERMWVNKRFHKDVDQADAQLEKPPAQA
jgi:hypothetical protein